MVNGLQKPQGGGGVPDGGAHVGLAAEGDAVLAGHFGQFAQAVNGLLEGGLVVHGAAGAAVDDRDADGVGGLEGGFHDGRVLAGLFHGLNGQLVFCRQGLDGLDQLFPSGDDEMLAHAVDGGDLDGVVAAGLGPPEGGLHVITAEQNRICT